MVVGSFANVCRIGYSLLQVELAGTRGRISPAALRLPGQSLAANPDAMIYQPRTVSFLAPVDEIAKTIESCGEPGVILLNDVPAAPLDSMQQMFDVVHASPDLGSRVNKAYTKNLVYKDSFGTGNGGENVDMKRVLDLSPERMDKITRAEPAIHTEIGSPLGTALAFWQEASSVQTKLLRAVALASGSDDVEKDAAANYRMVDYYERASASTPPRCNEHRDFGTFTLIFADMPGFEVCSDGCWVPVPPPPRGSALLLVGWCTQIRSNGRIPAALHRVVDPPASEHGVVPRRTSAVLFVAPKSVETALEPVVREGEVRQYISGIKVGQLRGNMARKWRHREGTLSAEDKELEEEEIRATRMCSQDDVVQRTVAARA